MEKVQNQVLDLDKMKYNQAKSDKKSNIVCPLCLLTTHQWNEVYFAESSKLIKAEKQFISMCSDSKEYVLSRGLNENKIELKKV